MVGVGYGKGATVDESQVRWVTADELEELRSREVPLRILDARDKHEFEAGSIPGAVSLAQSSIMFMVDQVRPLMDEILAGPADEQVVMFANTAGPNSGMTAGREVYVMAYLHELGLPMHKMERLSGGFRGWQESGRFGLARNIAHILSLTHASHPGVSTCCVLGWRGTPRPRRPELRHGHEAGAVSVTDRPHRGVPQTSPSLGCRDHG